jgi:molybdopterin-guanine dinucleotide biosynthesis protein B
VGVKPPFPVLQVVGYKNSGKTTFIQALIEVCAQEHLTIGVLKHHGHGGVPVPDNNKTDSAAFQNAGAAAVGVEGEGTFQFYLKSNQSLCLEDLILFYEKLPLDGLVIEGYKQAVFPKIVMLREPEDARLLKQLSNVMAVITCDEAYVETINSDIPVFLPHKDAGVRFALDWLKGESK